MMNYEKELKDAYGEIIETFHLKLIIISGEDFLLIGSEYALYISIYHDELNLWYIYRDAQGDLLMDLIDFYISEKSETFDRWGIIPAQTCAGRIKNGLIITARILKNHFSNILEGDKSWIEEYKKKNGDFDKPSKKLAQIVEKYF